MPRTSDREELIDEMEHEIYKYFEEIQYLIRNKLYNTNHRTRLQRMITIYEGVKENRYLNCRTYQVVDHTTLNFLLNNISDRAFKQQFRMERFNFDTIVSKIRYDEVLKG